MFTNVAHEEFAYLTTTGRRTGAPHEIEIWFATDGDVVWMISGGRDRSDWVQNLLATPDASLRLAGRVVPVRARPAIDDPAERRVAAQSLHAKYARQVSASAAEWEADAYLVAFDAC
jgi:deazaflavin-dependent oxidoreductase (nitroreductase family)